MKKMKMISILVISLLVTVFFTSCGEERVYIEGIENFNIATSTTSLNRFLLPSDDFLEKFECEKANYYYNDYSKTSFIMDSIEQSIIICEYSEEYYSDAKEYCINNMTLSEEIVFEHNGYSFAQRTDFTEVRDFPRYFTMFVYNDSNHTLIFMGFYATSDHHSEIQLAQDDWGAFLDKYYGDYYDFD